MPPAVSLYSALDTLSVPTRTGADVSSDTAPALSSGGSTWTRASPVQQLSLTGGEADHASAVMMSEALESFYRGREARYRFWRQLRAEVLRRFAETFDADELEAYVLMVDRQSRGGDDVGDEDALRFLRVVLPPPETHAYTNAHFDSLVRFLRLLLG